MAAPCNERVGRGVITFACDLGTGHTGPCRAQENQPSVRERERWQQSERAAADLAQFQGPAQTTAERYTENPTPVPISPGRRRLHAECSEVEGCLVNQHTECPVAWFDHKNAAVQAAAEPEHPISEGEHWAIPNGRVSRMAGRFWWHDDVGGALPVEIERAEALRLLAPTEAQKRPVPATEIDPPHPAYAQVASEHTTGLHGGFSAEPTKQREGDQVLPTINDAEDIQSQVIADIEARREVGISRYGTALQPDNKRDAMQDLYEELIDAACYIKQVLVERDMGLLSTVRR